MTIEDIKKNIPPIPFSELLKMEVLEIKEGYCKGRMPLLPQYGNPYRGLHGGAIYSLADTITGTAALAYGYYVITLNSSINYIKAVKDTEFLYCESRVVNQGSHIGVYHCDLTDDKGTLMASAEFSYYRLGPVKTEENQSS